MTFLFSVRKALTACIVTAVFTTTSMVALASSTRIVGELTVSGKAVDGEAPVAMVNGEASKSGRSVFSSSNISTPEDTNAVLSLGKAGRLEIDPNSSVNIVFDESSVDAELTSGRLTVLSSLGTVKVRTNDGKTIALASGDSITASGETQSGQQARAKNKNWWIWAVVAAGVGIAVIIAVSQSKNDTVVSPSR